MLLFWTVLIGVAQANGLVWKWESEAPVRYHIETVLRTPKGHPWVGRGENSNAQSIGFELALDLRCSGQFDGKRWDVECGVDNVLLRGQTVAKDQEELNTITGEGQAMLEGAVVALTIASDGRVRRVGFVGLEKMDQRHGAAIENLRLILRRALSPLDLQMPKNGEDKGKSWRQKGSPLALELLTASGTAGGIVMTHEVLGNTMTGVQIKSDGRGSMTEGAALEGATPNILRVTTSGVAEFDVQSGQLNWREYITEAGYTASSINAQMGGKAYVQAGWVGRYTADGTLRKPTSIKSR